VSDAHGFDLLAVEVFAWSPHLETACEICLREAARGRRVGFVLLDVVNVDEHPGPTVLARGIYRLLRETRQAKLRMIEQVLRSHGVTVIPAVTAPLDTPRISSARVGIATAEELRLYRQGGAALGLGALSSLIFHLGDAEPDVTAHRGLVDHLLRVGHECFTLTQRLIDDHAPGEVLVFNGRFACTKGIVEAARMAGVKVLYHEAGGKRDRYCCSEDPVHSASRARTALRKAWEQGGADREAVAAKYFAPGRGGETGLLEARFANPQQRGRTFPVTGRRRIVFYASSIDEYAAVEEGFDEGLFLSQRDAVEWMVAWVRAKPDHELILRIHPRMRNLTPRERHWWMSLAGENVTTLSAEDSADSYALAASADRVVCYHSSLGPEATWLGTVSILVGDASYRGLDCVYEPTSTDDLDRMLRDTSLLPKPARNCLPFGYRQMVQGTPYRFYEPTSFREGRFHGIPVPARPSPGVRALCKGLSSLESLIGFVRNGLAEWRQR
jgi:hypothetical protein